MPRKDCYPTNQKKQPQPTYVIKNNILHLYNCFVPNDILEKVKTIIFHDEPVSLSSLPKNITTLHYLRDVPENIPKVKTLIIGCDKVIKNIPVVEKLVLTNKYDQKISVFEMENATIIPDGVLELELDGDFDDVVVSLPESLRSLRVLGEYNRELNNLPRYLEELELGNNYNRGLNYLPGIRKLLIGNGYNRELDNLPNSLEFLSLGYKFNSSLHNLPTSIKYLILGKKFSQSIDTLSDNVEVLALGYEYMEVSDRLMGMEGDFDKKITKFPKNLRYLFVSGRYNYFGDLVGKDFEVISRVEVLHFSSLISKKN